MAEADQALTDPTQPQEELGGVMSLREHLDELRKRLTVAILAIILASFVVWPFKDFVFHFVQLPLPRGAILQQIAVTETLFTFVKISFIVGFGLASPIVVYQVLAFVAPGLYPQERRWLYMSIPAITLAFFAGVSFAWFVVLRFTVGFLAGFAPATISTEFTVDGWVSFVLRILLAVGLAFETPFIIFALAKIGLVTADSLASQRRYAIVAIAVISAIITPTPDPFTQASVGIPLYALYEVGVVLARVAAPADRPDDDTEPEPDPEDDGSVPTTA
ncbi:MAG: twin-arginine translocase subunit TatC [Chloroflexota bacterium]|nr:twin-arginine translocase subunit TatC [Chloroflexota bacterium]MDE2919540.1 twin-arginine translocase subunit TatC [Chloroflexota bacterium]